MSDWKTYPQEVPEEEQSIVFYSFKESSYFTGEYDYDGLVWGDAPHYMKDGDLWSLQGCSPPPPHSPQSAETAPLVEAAATTAARGDEISGTQWLLNNAGMFSSAGVDNDAITAEKLVKEGWVLYDNKYSIIEFGNLWLVFDCQEKSLFFVDGNETLEKAVAITTMSELRTLVRWLS